MNQEHRVLTWFEVQILIRAPQGLNDENRSSMMVRKMNGSDTLAQHSLNAQNFPIAM